MLHDDALLAQAKRRLDVVVSHMNPRGILFLWWLNKNNPADTKAITCDGGWPIWACGLLGRAMAAFYAGSGDAEVLRALETGYSSDRNSVRLAGGMSSVWPAFQAYTWTGNARIAEALSAVFSEDKNGADRPQGAGPDIAGCRTHGPERRPTSTGDVAGRDRAWALAICGRASTRFSTRPSPGTITWNGSRCNPPECRSWTSTTDQPATSAAPKPATWPATSGARPYCSAVSGRARMANPRNGLS